MTLPTITFVGQDGDGDTIGVNLNAIIQDDVPVNVQERNERGKLVDKTLSLDVEEDSVRGLNGNDGNKWFPEDNLKSYAFGGEQELKGVVNWGADDFGGLVGVRIGKTFNAMAYDKVTVYFDAKGKVTADETEAAAKLVVEANGAYTLTVLGAMEHARGDGANWLDLQTVSLVGQDGDGDKIAVNFEARVQDDVPVKANCLPMYALLEEESAPKAGGGVIGNNEDENGWLPGPGLSHTTGAQSMVGEVKWGADQFGGVVQVKIGTQTYDIAESGTTTIYLDQNGQPIVSGGSTTGAVELVVNGETGAYTLTVIGALNHGPNPFGFASVENLLTLPTITFVGQDGDGDTIGVDLKVIIQDDVPIARNDTDAVDNGVATGNVITGEETTTSPSGRDRVGADGATVTAITGHGGDDGDSNPMTAQGEYGHVEIGANGGYTYTFTGKTTEVDFSEATINDMPQTDNVQGMRFEAYKFGSPYASPDVTQDASGNVTDQSLSLDSGRDSTDADGIVTDQSNGLGVAGTQGGMPVPEQINHDAATGETEALAIRFAEGVVRADVRISNLFQNEGLNTNPNDGGETGRWEAFDADGNKIGEGYIGRELFDRDNGSTNQGTVEVEVLGGDGNPIVFNTLVFSSVPYLDGAGQGDSSDYFVKGVSYTGALVESVTDTFQYTLTDGDGDTATANLSIDIAKPTYDTSVTAVHEDALSTGNADVFPLEPVTVDDGKLNMGAATYTLSAPLHTVTSGGVALVWTASTDGDGNSVLTGTKGVEGETIMVMTMDKNTGDYTAELKGALDHDDNHPVSGLNEDLFIQFVAKVEADGTTQYQGFNVKVQDDAPVIEGRAAHILSESFEEFAPNLPDNDWAVVGEGGGTIPGHDGIQWTVNEAGIEIQSGNVGGSTASDGKVHAELDAHNLAGGSQNTLTVLSTQVDLPSSEFTMTFDYKPRPTDKADSPMTVKLGGVEVNITSDASGAVTVTPAAGVEFQTSSNSNGWTTITLSFSGLTTGSTQLSFAGGSDDANGDSYGAYLDNIHMFADRAVVTVDETFLQVDAQANLANFFDGKYGADGAALNGGLEYSLGVNGLEGGPVASGMTDTQSGEKVFLSVDQVTGQVVGITEESGETVFTASVDANGKITVEQVRAVVHGNTSNPNDAVHLDGLVNLTATITDGDGDSVSDTIDVGLTFLDDAAVATGAQNVVIANIAPQTTNLILTLDISGSMGDRVDDQDPNTTPDPTRLDIAINPSIK